MPKVITTKRTQTRMRAPNYVCQNDATYVSKPVIFGRNARPQPSTKPTVVKSTNRSPNARCNRAVAAAEKEWDPNKEYETKGSNRGDDITRYRYGVDADYAWCASFFNYLYNPQHIRGQNVFGMSDKDVMSTQKILKKAKENDCFASATSGYRPKVGDALIWTNDNDKSKGHICIVTEVRDDGSFVTIQGNNRDKVEKIEYESINDAMVRINSSGSRQTLQGFAQMSKYNNNHHLAANIDSETESLVNPDAGYCWVT